jgi:hypothetical protein
MYDNQPEGFDLNGLELNGLALLAVHKSGGAIKAVMGGLKKTERDEKREQHHRQQQQQLRQQQQQQEVQQLRQQHQRQQQQQHQQQQMQAATGLIGLRELQVLQQGQHNHMQAGHQQEVQAVQKQHQQQLHELQEKQEEEVESTHSSCQDHPNQRRDRFKAACLCDSGEKLGCCTRKCTECGFSRSDMSKCPCENSSSTCKYRHYDEEEYEIQGHTNSEGYGEKGGTRKRLVIKSTSSTRAKFMQHLKAVVDQFWEHQYIAHHQQDEFDRSIAKLPEDQILILEDFAMSYSHIHNGETQGEHWEHWSTTLFNTIVYAHRDNPEGMKVGKGVWATAEPFVSADRKHSNEFVRYCNEILIKKWLAINPKLKAVHIW